MATETVEMIAVLGELTAVCRDSASLFRSAAEQVKSPILNAQFNSYAQQRDLLAAELETAVRGLAEGLRYSIGPGIAHRWIPWRPAGRDGAEEGAVIAASIRNEDAALETYAQALQRNSAPAIRAVLERHREVIQESRRHLGVLLGRGPSADPSHVTARIGLRVRRRGAPGRRASERAGAKRSRPGRPAKEAKERS